MADSFLPSFDLSSVHQRLKSLCPSTTELMRQLTTTTRQRTEARNVLSGTTQAQDKAQQLEAKKLTVRQAHHIP